MFPNVQLVSTDGPDVTFIDPTGKPCIASTCANSATSPCSGVYFPTGANGRLEGFTVRNGRGLRQTCGGSCDYQIGGGITVFGSSPTITRNTIENNVVQGGATTFDFYGGGIYVDGTDASPARPVITRNLIRNNDVSPGGGRPPIRPTATAAASTPDRTAPRRFARTRSSRTVAGNGAADQVGVGAGIAIYSGWLGNTAIVQRNLIRGNDAYDYGGGMLLGESDPNADLVDRPVEGDGREQRHRRQRRVRGRRHLHRDLARTGTAQHDRRQPRGGSRRVLGPSGAASPPSPRGSARRSSRRS